MIKLCKASTYITYEKKKPSSIDISQTKKGFKLHVIWQVCTFNMFVNSFFLVLIIVGLSPKSNNN